MKTALRELLMELSLSVKRAGLERITAGMYDPKRGMTSEEILSDLGFVFLKLATLQPLAERLDRASDAQYVDLRKVLERTIAAPWPDSIRDQEYLYSGITGIGQLSPEQRARIAKANQEREEYREAHKALNECLGKIGKE